MEFMSRVPTMFLVLFLFGNFLNAMQLSVEPSYKPLVIFIEKHGQGKCEILGKDRKTLEDYAREIILGDSQYDAADDGGPLGKEFFASMQPTVVMRFSEIIKKIRTSLPAESVDLDDKMKKLFSNFLNLLGDERRLLALITGNADSDKFGSRDFSGPLPGVMNRIVVTKECPEWSHWHHLLKAKVQQMTIGEDLAKIYERAQKEGIVTISKGTVALDISAQGDHFPVCLRHHKDNPLEKAWKSDPFPRSGDQSVAYHWILKDLNKSSLFPCDEKEIIYCYHKPGVGLPSLVDQEIISVGFNNFKNILYWDGSSVDDFVIGQFASLLWNMSHSSIYHRGQSDITRWFLAILAKGNSYELSFSDQWDAKLNMATEDMQAMLEFDREKFVEDCVAQGLIKLEKILDPRP